MLENMRKAVSKQNQRKYLKYRDSRYKNHLDKIRKLNHRNKKGDYYWKLPSINQRFGIIR